MKQEMKKILDKLNENLKRRSRFEQQYIDYLQVSDVRSMNDCFHAIDICNAAIYAIRDTLNTLGYKTIIRDRLFVAIVEK